MASKVSQDIPRNPTWDTWVERAASDGRLTGKAGAGVWLYRRVPMSPVADAKTREQSVLAGRSMAAAFQALASLASSSGNRQMAKGSYREFHVLWVNVPVWFRAPAHLPTAAMLNDSYRGEMTMRKECLFGVRLLPTAGSGGIRSALESVSEQMLGTGRPLSDYDRDYDRLAGMLQGAGLEEVDAETLRFMQSWWTHGEPRAAPIVAHLEHQHFFETTSAVERLQHEFNPADCDEWADELRGQFSLSFANVRDFDFGDGVEPGHANAWWLRDLAQRGARAVSVRGMVEPTKVTRAELRRQRKGIRGDMNDAAAAQKDERSEVDEQKRLLDHFEAAAGTNQLPPTLVDVSTVAAFNGIVAEVDRLSTTTVQLTPMTNVQPAAWHETMLCSAVRANPVLHELSAHAVAHAAFQDRSALGDRDGAIIGWSDDGQAVYVSPSAASRDEDAAPLLGLYAASGSGKTVLAQWMAYQWSFSRPVALIDPKPDSDLSGLVEAANGRKVSFDDFISSDGALDAITNASSPLEGVPLAAQVVGLISPMTSLEYRRHETEVVAALQYGVERGARATGQALTLAAQAGLIAPTFVDDLVKTVRAEPRFAAAYGLTGQTPPLRVAHGLTLFMAGQRQLDLPARPAPGTQPRDLENESIAVRSTVNLLRMLARVSLGALRGTGGVLAADEAHLLERAAPDELEQIGRLSRSWDVMTVLMTQTPSGPKNLGLGGYISSGLIGHIPDKVESAAAMEMFGITKPEVLQTVREPGHLSGGRGNNWASLKALWDIDPATNERKLVRPAKFIYRDLRDSAGAVEARIPAWFLQFASTNPEDRRRYAAAKAQQQEAVR